jgi:hypothetical protein
MKNNHRESEEKRKAMKLSQTIFRLTLIISIVSTMIVSISCSRDKTPANDYIVAVEKVTASAIKLTIKSYITAGSQVTIDKSNPDFGVIVKYIEQSKITREQPRYGVLDGKTVEVGIPYVRNYAMAFIISDGSPVTFDFGAGELWYISDKTIYSASVDTGLNEVFQQLIK